MLPMTFFRSRAFSATNVVSLAMYFGMFGAIFLLAQFFQTAQGLSPIEAGMRTLPWTAMPIFVAPLAGLLSDRIGSRPLMAAGLALQATALAWLASELLADAVLRPDGRAVHPRRRRAWRSCSRRRRTPCSARSALRQAGQASGATNAIREVGGVLGIAVLASVFRTNGGYTSAHAFVSGLTPAVGVAAAVLAFGALAALAVPGIRRSRASHAQPATGIA